MKKLQLFCVMLAQSGCIIPAQAEQVRKIVEIVKQIAPGVRRQPPVPLPAGRALDQSVDGVFEQIRDRNGQSFVRQRIDIDQIPVYRLKVLEQGDVAQTRRAGKVSWTCGFHSLKNVLYVLQALQQNPMTVAIANQLFTQLNDQDIFLTLFLNAGSLDRLGPLSWFGHFIADLRVFDGIFPGDQRLLIAGIRVGQRRLPENFNLNLLERVFPVEALEEDILGDDYLLTVMEGFGRLIRNEWSAIAFTLPPAGVQHFIGVVLHRVNTAVGLEIFVVDSLNSDLSAGRIAAITPLIEMYQDVRAQHVR